MNPTRWAISLEQFRQARRIHGGLLGMGVAALGVKLSRMPIPRRLRGPVYRRIFGGKYQPLDEHEAELALSDYRSLNAVFTRGLKPGTRPSANCDAQFVSPCDSQVQAVGEVTAETVLKVKEIDYTLASLLPECDVTRFAGGRFAILFLSPTDCHRVFAPQTGTIDRVQHVPGSRLLVHPPFQRKEFPVFTLNERVIFHLDTPQGRAILVMVAGWGVGHITLPFDPEFRPKPRSRRVTDRRYEPAASVSQGDWIGTFELGSTVILITEPTAGPTLVSPDQTLRIGQPLFGSSLNGRSPAGGE